jgi:hypothetical protein
MKGSAVENQYLSINFYNQAQVRIY